MLLYDHILVYCASPFKKGLPIFNQLKLFYYTAKSISIISINTTYFVQLKFKQALLCKYYFVAITFELVILHVISDNAHFHCHKIQICVLVGTRHPVFQKNKILFHRKSLQLLFELTGFSKVMISHELFLLLINRISF